MRYPKFMAWINRIVAYICGLVVLIISILAVMESILRKIFSAPTIWTFNISCGMFIWVAFLGSSWAFQELGHVSVDLVRNAIDKHTKSTKRWPRRCISIFGYIASFATTSALLYGGFRLCQRALTYNQFAPYPFRFPLIISYSAIVAGSLLMMLTLVFILLDLFAGGDKYV